MMRMRVRRASSKPQLWIIEPEPPNQLGHFWIATYGRREIALPAGAILAATWAEAIQYANCPRGINRPRPIHHVYPEYCGMDAKTALWLPAQYGSPERSMTHVF